MGEVYELDLTRGQQSVLLAMAEHADDDGGRCFPSVEYLTWKTGYRERQVQRIRRDLEELGLIVPVAHQRGGRGHATEYRIDLSKGVKKTPYERGKGVISDAQRVSSATQKGVISNTKGVISDVKGAIAMTPQPSVLTTIEPSEEPSVVNSRARKAHSTSRPRTTIPPDLTLTPKMRTYLLEKCPDADPEAEFEHYHSKHTAKGDLSTDWEGASWRTWVINAKKWGHYARLNGHPASNGHARAAPKLTVAQQREAEVKARAEQRRRERAGVSTVEWTGGT